MKKEIAFLFCLSFLIQGCATVFTGSPTISRKDCEAQCDEWGMTLSSMVQMGKYSNGCVCKNKSDKVSRLDNGDSAGAIAAISGVEMQRQRAAQAQHH